MKTSKITLSYEDREKGREHHHVSVDASSLPGAAAKATRDYVKGLDRKQRFDMNNHGLEIPRLSTSRRRRPARRPKKAESRRRRNKSRHGSGSPEARRGVVNAPFNRRENSAINSIR